MPDAKMTPSHLDRKKVCVCGRVYLWMFTCVEYFFMVCVDICVCEREKERERGASHCSVTLSVGQNVHKGHGEYASPLRLAFYVSNLEDEEGERDSEGRGGVKKTN